MTLDELLMKEKVAYRVGKNERGSDLDALEEVCIRRCYRRAKIKFDVEAGDHWLDLGANIGAFAIYCRLRGATADCYEPDKSCFELLKQNHHNVGGNYNAAVTSHQLDYLPFYGSANPDNHYRGTVVEAGRVVPQGSIENEWAGNLEDRGYAGIKMDIEGSEGPLIDEWLLPPCQKLVMEYHTSRDPSVANLKRRIRVLEKRFRHLKYPRAFDEVIARGLKEYRPRFDQLIFCWGPK